jgi:hypothetical protein
MKSLMQLFCFLSSLYFLLFLLFTYDINLKGWVGGGQANSFS